MNDWRGLEKWEEAGMTQDRQIRGRHYPAGGSAAVAALLERKGDIFTVTNGDGETTKVGVTGVSERIANLPRRINLADGSVFETADNAGVDKMFGTSGFTGLLYRLEANWKVVAVLAVATIGLLWAAFTWGLPAAASFAARITPPVAMSAIDRGVMRSVDTSFFSPSTLDEGRQRELSRQFTDLVDLAGVEHPRPHLLFRDGGRLGANAFALPGGTVVLTDQLVGEAKNDDEIAGVLAHEIGHVVHRHSLKQIYRVLGVGFLIGVVSGDTSQLVEEVATQAALLQNFSYSREFEIESDRYSVELMVKAGRDPVAFVDLLDRITDNAPSARTTNWFSTHPGTEDRRDNVDALVEELRQAR